MADSDVDSELDVTEDMRMKEVNPANDDDNYSVMSEASDTNSARSVHTLDFETIDSLKPAGSSLEGRQIPYVHLIIPNRKVKIGKNQALLLGYVQDVVEKVTNGIDQAAVVEMVKRKITTEKGYDMAAKFMNYIQSTEWPDMQAEDDKDEDSFLKQMSNLSVSIVFQY
jgi:hypothetical protein